MRLAVAVAVLAAGVLLLGACAPPAEVPPDPGPTAEPTPSPDPEENDVDAAIEPPGVPVEPPGVAVAATEDHRVVVIDTETGQEIGTLASYDDPDAFGEETGEPVAAGSFFDSLALSPDALTAYVSVCCEPAPGRLYRAGVDGGEPEQLGHGYEPAVRADGAQIAVTEMQWISIIDPDGEPIHRFELRTDMPMAVSTPVWSPDGRTLAFLQVDDSWAQPRLMLVDAEADSMEDARALPRPVDAEHPWVAPTFNRAGQLVVAEQTLDGEGRPVGGPAAQLVLDPVSGEVVERRELPASVRTQVHDASGGWLLAVLTDGTARWWGPDGQEGSLGSGLLAAAW